MSNPKITTEYSNTQLTLPLEVKEENSVKKEKVLPKFKPYNNKQSFFIHNLEELMTESSFCGSFPNAFRKLSFYR